METDTEKNFKSAVNGLLKQMGLGSFVKPPQIPQEPDKNVTIHIGPDSDSDSQKKQAG